MNSSIFCYTEGDALVTSSSLMSEPGGDHRTRAAEEPRMGSSEVLDPDRAPEIDVELDPEKLLVLSYWWSFSCNSVEDSGVFCRNWQLWVHLYPERERGDLRPSFWVVTNCFAEGEWLFYDGLIAAISRFSVFPDIIRGRASYQHTPHFS